jgi:hypothetical protein
MRRRPVPSLAELQDAFGRAIWQGAAEAVAGAIRDDGIAPGARVALYRHHVFTTLTATLAWAYPVVVRLVDERFFAYASDRYVRAHPPAGPCLAEYGASLAEFLAAFPPCRALPYLPDVARLEWAMHRALHAPDAAPLDPALLRAVPAEAAPGLRFHLDPSLSLVRSPWPIDRIWRANQPGADPADRVDLGAGGARLEVRRLGDDVVFRALDAPTFVFRQALSAGQEIETAAEVALAEHPGFDLTAAIQDLLREEVLVGFEIQPLTQEAF